MSTPCRRTTVLLVLASFGVGGAARAQDPSWILEPQLTPAGLAADGASLTANESVRWPDGPSVELTYWLGPGDIVYRCATLLADGATDASCWRRAEVIGADDGARRSSTRRRPPPVIVDAAAADSYAPYVYLEGLPWRPRVPSRPRPTPLPTR